MVWWLAWKVTPKADWAGISSMSTWLTDLLFWVLLQNNNPKCPQGSCTLDILTRQYILQYFHYQYLIVGQSKEAFAIERLCQAGYIFNQKPYLNPIASSPSVSDLQILQAFLDKSSCWVPNLGSSFRANLLPQKELKAMMSVLLGVLMLCLQASCWELTTFVLWGGGGR